MFISHCAQEYNRERADQPDDDSESETENDESLSFSSLLCDLKESKKGCETIGDLPLITIYRRIVCGVLHCLPSARKHLEADSGILQFEKLLKGLVLEDLFPDGLHRYVFNLPQSMMADIKMYKNHCVIGKRDSGKSSWVATFRANSVAYNPQLLQQGGVKNGNDLNDMFEQFKNMQQSR